MLRRTMLLLLLAMFIGRVGSFAEPAQDASQESQETTVVGCLQSGANTGEFVLVNDDKATYQIQAGEELEIGAHVNHRVELTGTIEMTEPTMTFKAKELKMVSTTCAL